MTTPTINEFQNLAEANGLRFDGLYCGRFRYEGIALVVDDLGEAGMFVKDMENAGYTLGRWDHSDSMGLGVVVGWSTDRFDEDDLATWMAQEE